MSPSSPAARKRPRVLVLDDEEMLCDLYAEVLSSNGYDAVTAGTAAEAMAVLASLDGDVDLMILDIRLPDGNGVDVGRQAREKYGGRPTLFVTGALQGAAPMLEGADFPWKVLHKPVPVPDLLQNVQWLLGPSAG